MDLIRQNKLIGWVIAILVALNLLTLTTIWIQSERKSPPPAREPSNRQAGSVPLLQREIGLTADQAKSFEDMRRNYQEKTKPINDELDGLKLRIADEIFNTEVDKRVVDTMAARIGILQSKIEVLRFEHFSDLVKICTPEQKEKLQPILREVFGRKGPAERPALRPDQKKAPQEQPQRERPRDGQRRGDELQERRPPPPGDRPAPPSLEDKLNRYAQRLSLTPEQIRKVDDILKRTRTKEEAFKAKMKPTEAEFEREKQRLRKEEDESILGILNQDQKMEFEQMAKSRSKPIRN